MDEIIKDVVTSATKEIAKDVYSDTLKPAAKNLGEIFGSITGFFNHVVMYPLKKLSAKYEFKAKAFREKLEKGYKSIPEEDVAEPDLHIIGPALESLKYNIMEDDLADMFANLLISDMDAKTKNLCTPAFVRIIEQLSPIDARVFKIIFDQCVTRVGIPVCELTYSLEKDKNKYAVVNLPKHIVNINLFNIDPFLISKSIHMLNRLGLISVDMLKSFTNQNIYEALITQDYYAELHKVLELTSGNKYIPKVLDKGVIRINELSKDFAKVCLRKTQ